MSTKRERREIYNTPRWRALRARAVRRAGYLCRHCAERGFTSPAQVVHHIEPIRDGGDPWDESNLVALCRACHDREHDQPKPLSAPDKNWQALVHQLYG